MNLLASLSRNSLASSPFVLSFFFCLLSLTSTTSSQSTSTSTSSLPPCYLTCLEKNNPHCADTDLSCLCNYSAHGSSSLATCLPATCPTNLPSPYNTPLTALQQICNPSTPTAPPDTIFPTPSAVIDSATGTQEPAADQSAIVSELKASSSSSSTVSHSTASSTSTPTATAKAGSGGGGGTVLDLQGGAGKRGVEWRGLVGGVVVVGMVVGGGVII